MAINEFNKGGGNTCPQLSLQSTCLNLLTLFLLAAVKLVRSVKLGISHQCNTLCASMGKETHIAPRHLYKPCHLYNHKECNLSLVLKTLTFSDKEFALFRQDI